MKLITIQHKKVFTDITKNGVYRAYLDRVSSNLVEPYKFMMKHFGWDSCPIFLAPVGYYVEMGGAKFDNEHVAIELDIPDEFVKIQRYYDWSDFIYFTELPWEFKESFNTEKYETVEDWAKTIMNIEPIKDKLSPLQATVSELRKEWVVGIKVDLSKLAEQHDGSGGGNILLPMEHYI